MQTQTFSSEKRECLRLKCVELEDVGKCMHGLFNFIRTKQKNWKNDSYFGHDILISQLANLQNTHLA